MFKPSKFTCQILWLPDTKNSQLRKLSLRNDVLFLREARETKLQTSKYILWAKQQTIQMAAFYVGILPLNNQVSRNYAYMTYDTALRQL